MKEQGHSLGGSREQGRARAPTPRTRTRRTPWKCRSGEAGETTERGGREGLRETHPAWRARHRDTAGSHLHAGCRHPGPRADLLYEFSS